MELAREHHRPDCLRGLLRFWRSELHRNAERSPFVMGARMPFSSVMLTAAGASCTASRLLVVYRIALPCNPSCSAPTSSADGLGELRVSRCTNGVQRAHGYTYIGTCTAPHACWSAGYTRLAPRALLRVFSRRDVVPQSICRGACGALPPPR